MCYAELRKAWKEGCRPVIGFDGCFIKTVCGGQLLSVVGRDGLNSIFPIAMAVVETESYDSWRWFLMLLIDDLVMDIPSYLTSKKISDQQKVHLKFCFEFMYIMYIGGSCNANTSSSLSIQGLEKAVKELLPYVEHRNCTRHIYSNLQKKHRNEAVRNAFYQTSMATFPEGFKASMRDLEKASKRAFEKMNKFEPKFWSKAFYFELIPR